MRCAAFTALLQDSFSGDLEGEGLSYGCVGSNLHDGVRLIGIAHRLKWRAGRGRELHGPRQHGDKVLQGIKRFRIEIGLSGVGQRVGYLKLREAGAQRKQE